MRRYPAGSVFPVPFGVPAFASCAFLYPLRDWPALAMGLLDASSPQRGYHVPHRQDASDELASRRREQGTVSADPLTSADHRSIKDVSTPFVPSLRYDASIKALRVFNSSPTSPGIDFRWGSLLSFCVYCLLEPPRLLAMPRQSGDGHLMLAQSAIISL
jgi:hypothetical protein